jgi:hypothetical protein
MDQVRAWFKNYTADLERVRRFWQGEGRYLVSLTTAQEYYRQTFDDELMLSKAPRQLEFQASLPGINLPTFTADFGTVSTARYWGGQTHFDSTGVNLFIDPAAQTLDEALKLKPLPVDHPGMDAAHGLRLFQQLCQSLETGSLWFRSPDMQGTLNTAGLILNQEHLLVDMFSEKSKVHVFLDRVSDFLIEYALYLRRQTADASHPGGKVCGNLWPYSFIPDGLGISFTEDLMPLLSSKMYREFALPYLRKFHSALGGMMIHCCGDWGRHARTLQEAGLNLLAMEFHHPLTRLEELECLADQTVFIPYVLGYRQKQFQNTAEYYRYLIEESPANFRFWFACAEETPEMLRFVEEYGEGG